MNILALDPGGTTGIAVKANDTYATAVASEPSQVWEWLTDDDLKIDLVLVERFATGAWIDRYGLRTVEIVGGIEALCHYRKLAIIRKTPSQRAPGIPEATRMVNAKPELASLASKPKSHHIDALAHILAHERIMRAEQK